MRGEIYVLSLLRVSELARNVVTEHLPGAMAHSDVLAELTDPERRNLAGARYEYLATKLAEAFKPAPPPRFTESTFDELLRPAVRRALAVVLQCRPEDTLASLFDPVQIRRELDDVRRGPGTGQRNLDPESVIYELLSGPGSGRAVTRIRQRYQFSENDWGNHLERRGWLLDTAAELLQKEATRRGWSRLEPSRVLAGIVAGAGRSVEATAESEHFDALAIVYLRRLAAGLADNLREEAEANINRAISRVPGSPGLIKLRGWLDLYERNSLTRGLLKLCGGTVSLHMILGREHCQDKAVIDTYEKPLQPDPMIIANVSEFTRKRWREAPEEYVTFEVQCRIGDEAQPVTILTVVQLLRTEFLLVRPVIERLRGTDLVADGPTLGKRLLNTPVATNVGVQGALRGYLERNAARFAQTIVLSGISQPLTAAGVPWRRALRDDLGFTVRESTRDVEFPKTRAKFVAELTEQYDSDGRGLTVDTDPP
jgi:hypothetical protein